MSAEKVEKETSEEMKDASDCGCNVAGELSPAGQKRATSPDTAASSESPVASAHDTFSPTENGTPKITILRICTSAEELEYGLHSMSPAVCVIYANFCSHCHRLLENIRHEQKQLQQMQDTALSQLAPTFYCADIALYSEWIPAVLKKNNIREEIDGVPVLYFINKRKIVNTLNGSPSNLGSELHNNFGNAIYWPTLTTASATPTAPAARTASSSGQSASQKKTTNTPQKRGPKKKTEEKEEKEEPLPSALSAASALTGKYQLSTDKEKILFHYLSLQQAYFTKHKERLSRKPILGVRYPCPLSEAEGKENQWLLEWIMPVLQSQTPATCSVYILNMSAVPLEFDVVLTPCLWVPDTNGRIMVRSLLKETLIKWIPELRVSKKSPGAQHPPQKPQKNKKKQTHKK